MVEDSEKVSGSDLLKGLLTKALQSKWINSRKYVGTIITTLLALFSDGGLDMLDISQENMVIIAAIWWFWVALESLIEVAKTRFAKRDAVITDTLANGNKVIRTITYKK